MKKYSYCLPFYIDRVLLELTVSIILTFLFTCIRCLVTNLRFIIKIHIAIVVLTTTNELNWTGGRPSMQTAVSN